MALNLWGMLYDIYNWFVAHYALFKDFAAPVATIIAAGTALWVTIRLGRAQVAIAQQQAATPDNRRKLL
jgi:hypothetical protein